MTAENQSFERLFRIISRGYSEPSDAAILWVGAGLAVSAGYPSWNQLAEDLRARSVAPLDPKLSGPALIDAFVNANGRGERDAALADVFRYRAPLPLHCDIVRLPWHAIVTTNYDELLEDACKAAGVDFLLVTLEQNLSLLRQDRLPIIKIHGGLSDICNIILERDSYKTYAAQHPLSMASMEVQLRTHPIVFIGCSMTDPRLVQWLRSLDVDARSNLRASVAILTQSDWEKIDASDRDLLLGANINPILVKTYGQIPELISGLLRQFPPRQQDEVVCHIVALSNHQWSINWPDADVQQIRAPWSEGDEFRFALRDFWQLSREPALSEALQSELHRAAITVGKALLNALFGSDEQKLRRLIDSPGIPLIVISSEDTNVLSLPWELLWYRDTFLVRDARIDIARTVPISGGSSLGPADRPFRLLVNISAPSGSSLHYEAEHYRIIRALYDTTLLEVTELGTVDDLIDSLKRSHPIGVHFSGHGGPRSLQFEDEEGSPVDVTVDELLSRLRTITSNYLPPFFYLANCHGNDPSQERDLPTAAELHKAGITQVVAYNGPIVDELSTRAEVALYEAISSGEVTLLAVRLARRRLSEPFSLYEGFATHRDVRRGSGYTHSFAWAQLVLYLRGTQYPLSKRVRPENTRTADALLQRQFRDAGTRRELEIGFIGRRLEQHRARKLIRKGQRVFVIQGLGGIGKSAFAFQMLKMFSSKGATPVVLWCQETTANSPIEQLTKQLNNAGDRILGPHWQSVAEWYERQFPVASVSEHFLLLVSALAERLPSLTIYLDNLETFLAGPEDSDRMSFGSWSNAHLASMWLGLRKLAEQEMITLLATSRYQNSDFDDALFPLDDMPRDATFRLMNWYPTLSQLSTASRIRLVDILSGHPRAVGFLEDLIKLSELKYEKEHGVGSLNLGEKTVWAHLIEPALPIIGEKLGEDLLFTALWAKVLDERARRMLCRMTVLFRPFDWNIVKILGEPNDSQAAAERTAAHLCSTSLLEQSEQLCGKEWIRLYVLHPITVDLILRHTDSAATLRTDAYLRVGTFFEELNTKSWDLQLEIDAGYYLFQAEQYDRSFSLLSDAAQTCLNVGRGRAAVTVLAPFLHPSANSKLNYFDACNLFRLVGNAFAMLGRLHESSEMHQRASEFARLSGNRLLEGRCLNEIGESFRLLGQLEKAMKFYEQAIAIAREIGDRKGEGIRQGNVGLIHRTLGQLDLAIKSYEQALAIAREVADRKSEANHLGNLGNAFMLSDQLDKALESHLAALAIRRGVGDRRAEGKDLGNIGLVHLKKNELEKAGQLFEEALNIAREVNDRISEAGWLTNLATVSAEHKHYDKAIAYLKSAIDICRETGAQHDEAVAFISLASIYMKRKMVGSAVAAYAKAHTIAKQLSDRQIENIATEMLSRLRPILQQYMQHQIEMNKHLEKARRDRDSRLEQQVLEQLRALSLTLNDEVN